VNVIIISADVDSTPIVTHLMKNDSFFS